MSAQDDYVRNATDKLRNSIGESPVQSDVVPILEGILHSMEKEYPHPQTKGNKKPPKTEKRDAPETLRRSNWQAIWTSNEYGCKAYEPFGDKLKTLSDEHKELPRFGINKMLREWAMSNGRYVEWQNWARERMEANNKQAPPLLPEKSNSRRSGKSGQHHQTASKAEVPAQPVHQDGPEQQSKSELALPKEVTINRARGNRASVHTS